jgi:hypothetical protein
MLKHSRLPKSLSTYCTTSIGLFQVFRRQRQSMRPLPASPATVQPAPAVNPHPSSIRRPMLLLLLVLPMKRRHITAALSTCPRSPWSILPFPGPSTTLVPLPQPPLPPLSPVSLWRAAAASSRGTARRL